MLETDKPLRRKRLYLGVNGQSLASRITVPKGKHPLARRYLLLDTFHRRGDTVEPVADASGAGTAIRLAIIVPNRK